MKQVTKLIWILICLTGFSNNLSASNSSRTDSTKITRIINEFYDWYLTAIKEKSNSEYTPRYVKTQSGMTSLNFSKYIKNLKANGFSDSLIFKEKQSYSNCIKNLGKIKYSDFRKITFTDLDEYEQANCDFRNYYRWIGGQETIDGIRIIDIKFISADLVSVSIDYFKINIKENKRYYSGKNSLTLKRLNNKWLIDQVDSWKTD